jgi:hypothetical protein
VIWSAVKQLDKLTGWLTASRRPGGAILFAQMSQNPFNPQKRVKQNKQVANSTSKKTPRDSFDLSPGRLNETNSPV